MAKAKKNDPKERMTKIISGMALPRLHKDCSWRLLADDNRG
jgi:hypothetical protein